jgi:hypothetical protein
VLNDPNWPVTWLAALLRSLIARGAVYLVFWGERCEEAHDIADRVRDPLPADGDDVVMTTWHTRESLIDYLWFVAFVTCPTSGYVSDENRYLILDIGRGLRFWRSERCSRSFHLVSKNEAPHCYGASRVSMYIAGLTP